MLLVQVMHYIFTVIVLFIRGVGEIIHKLY